MANIAQRFGRFSRLELAKNLRQKQGNRVKAGLLLVTCFAQFRALASDRKCSAKEILTILQENRFRPIHHVSDLPRNILVAAGVIPRNRTLESVLAGPGREYQSGHAGIDPSQAEAQLMFGAISEQYLLFCYRAGGLTEAEHVTLIHFVGRGGARLFSRGVVYPEARNLSALTALLEENHYVPFDTLDPSMVLP